MRNDFQYDAPRAGLMPEPDGSYIIDQQRAALLRAYVARKEEERRNMLDMDDDYVERF